MSENSAKCFLVIIDGERRDICGDLASAKQKAISLANGVSSILITSGGPGAVSSSAWYWDYKNGAWVFSENAVFAKAKRKDE